MFAIAQVHDELVLRVEQGVTRDFEVGDQEQVGAALVEVARCTKFLGDKAEEPAVEVEVLESPVGTIGHDERRGLRRMHLAYPSSGRGARAVWPRSLPGPPKEPRYFVLPWRCSGGSRTSRSHPQRRSRHWAWWQRWSACIPPALLYKPDSSGHFQPKNLLAFERGLHHQWPRFGSARSRNSSRPSRFRCRP